jgi:hypothetical protein
MPEDAPLTYGQLYSRREIEAYPAAWRHEANLSTTVLLPGVPAAQVEAAMSGLFRRHEPLRTTYEISDGLPVQRVHDEIALPVRRIDRALNSPEDAEQITIGLARQPFPLTGALCWGAILVNAGTASASLSLSFSHLIVDIWAIRRLADEFRALLMNPQALDDTPVTSSLRLAATQREATSGPRPPAAEKYWHRILDDDLVHRPPVPADGVESPRIQATLHSTELSTLALRAASARGVTVPAVFMAVVTAGYAHCVGARRVPLSLMASNRFAPQDREVVGTMNQLIPVVTTVDPDAPLAEHITRLHWSAAKAYRHACYDTDRVVELAGGADFNTLFPTWFNYLHLDDEPATTQSSAAEVVWAPEPRQCGQAFDVRITASGGRTSVAVRVDPRLIPAPELTALLGSIAHGVRLAGSAPYARVADVWSDQGLGGLRVAEKRGGAGGQTVGAGLEDGDQVAHLGAR